MTKKNKTIDWTIKGVSAKTKDEFVKIQKENEFSNQLETIDFLIKFYNSKTKGRNQEKNDPLMSAQMKLHKIWNAVKEHNIKELKKPKREGKKNYITFENKSMISKSSGLNRSRDISPFLVDIWEDYKAHFEKLDIEVDDEKKKLALYKMTSEVTRKNHSGESVMFKELLQNIGLR